MPQRKEKKKTWSKSGHGNGSKQMRQEQQPRRSRSSSRGRRENSERREIDPLSNNVTRISFREGDEVMDVEVSPEQEAQFDEEERMAI